MPNPILARSIAVATTLLFASAAHAANRSVPFDFSHHAIGLNVTVRGKPLYVLLDTGVDPSVIDLQRAKALGLPMQKGQGGEATGEGNGSAHVFPATIKMLAIDGHAWGDVDALAMDMAGLSKSYGKTLDGVLGYSFLSGKTVVIDYPSSNVTFYKGSHPVAATMKQCKLHYATPLVFAGAGLARELRAIDAPRWLRALSAFWCVGIVYSTLATRQHVVLDVVAGALLGALVALAHAGWERGAVRRAAGLPIRVRSAVGEP